LSNTRGETCKYYPESHQTHHTLTKNTSPKGRFSSYTYKILHIVTIGHTHLVEKPHSIYRGTKQLRTPPKSPIKQGYEWLFGEPNDPKADAEYEGEPTERRRGDSERRKEGYEWLFE